MKLKNLTLPFLHWAGAHIFWGQFGRTILSKIRDDEDKSVDVSAFDPSRETRRIASVPRDLKKDPMSFEEYQASLKQGVEEFLQKEISAERK